MTLPVDEWLVELEGDLAGADMIDLDGFLRTCGYICFSYEDLATVLYRHEEWGSMLTFPQGIRTVPRKRLTGILEMVRANLMREGKI